MKKKIRRFSPKRISRKKRITKKINKERNNPNSINVKCLRSASKKNSLLFFKNNYQLTRCNKKIANDEYVRCLYRTVSFIGYLYPIVLFAFLLLLVIIFPSKATYVIAIFSIIFCGIAMRFHHEEKLGTNNIINTLQDLNESRFFMIKTLQVEAIYFLVAIILIVTIGLH